MIILFVVGTGLKVMKVLDRAEDAFDRIETDPATSSVVAVGTATPKPTSAVIQKPTQLAIPRPTRTPISSPWDIQASKVVEAMDYTNSTTRDYALSLISREHSGKYNIAQICDMWDKIYKQWTYVNDPKGSNYYSPASRTIKLGVKGDCDDFAILVASTMMAIGGSSRIILASNTGGSGHAYAEVYLGPSKSNVDSAAKYICQRYKCRSVAYRISNEGGQTRYWLNLDWQAKHPGGPYYKNDGETIAIYENKYWVRLK
jgi:transglutaminase-like putative cysteine protease